MKQIYVILVLLLISFQTNAQIDKEFWFVAPDLAQSHGDRPIYMRISTMEDTANITLRMPANLGFTPITQQINPNTTFSIDLTTWINIIENTPANTVLDRGLLLTSNRNVTAYYECANASNPGIFSLKGKNAVGIDFYIVSQNDYANQVGQESFEIVATEDHTIVTIVPSDDIVGHTAGTPFQVTLDKGETFSCRAVYTSAAHTLNGSHITSDKPIAVTWQDDSLYQGGAYDVVCDQIIPVNILGMKYIAIRGWANTNERVYVCGTQSNTDIFINGNPVAVANIQAGELYKYQLPTTDNTVYLEASKPVHVMHLSGFGNELGASILPQDSCTGSAQIGFNRTNANNFALLILTRDGNEANFLLNGSAAIITAADFATVPGTGSLWVYARKQLTTGQVPVGPNLIKNTTGKFHLGIVHQTGASAEYGYFSDFSSLYLGADASFCPGDSVELDGGENMDTYEWYKLEGTTWVLVGDSQYYMVHDSGYYSCVVNGNYCTLADTIHFSLYPNATVDLGPDQTICEGTSTTFDAGSFVSYHWSNGAASQTITTGTGGEYWVRVVNNNDCIAWDTVMLYIDSLPRQPTGFYGADTVCQGEQNVYYAVDSIHFAQTYLWSMPPGASGSSDTAEITLNYSTTASSGEIHVYGQNGCGDGPDTTIFITVNPLPYPAGDITGPDTVCQTESGIMFTTDAIMHAVNYLWILPPGASIISGDGTDTVYVDFDASAQSGEITVCGENSCGNGDSSMFALTVKLFPVPAGPLTGDDTVCQGATGLVYEVDTIDGASAYLWSLPTGASIISGDSTRSIIVDFDSTAQSGNVIVTGWSDCGVGDSTVTLVTVNPLPEPAGMISGEDTVCQGFSGAIYQVGPVAHASTYLWTLPPGVTLVNGAGTNQITVDFSAAAQSGLITVRGHNDTCGDGRQSTFPVFADPLPVDAGTISGPDTVCQNQSAVVFTVPAIQYADNYLWNYSGSGVTLTSNGTSVSLDFSPSATSGALTVRGQNHCGNGVASPLFPIQVNPHPDVSLRICQPYTTREAQPFRLRGGIPLEGNYSGAGVSAGWFTPSLIPIGTDTIAITYEYTNMYGCIFSDTQQIFLLPVVPFTCGDSLNDPRDSLNYPTILIGTQCWMAANLNFGRVTPSSQLQLDNCIHEKYCYNDNPSNCDLSGGLYQWNEMMDYDNAEGIQGFCPPGWHVPTESDWALLFSQYVNSGFAGNPLKSGGYSGFNALLSGIRFHTSIWKYPSADPTLRSILFWSSTSHSSTKSWAHGLNEVVANTEYTPSASFYPALNSNAFAVRCVED